MLHRGTVAFRDGPVDAARGSGYLYATGASARPSRAPLRGHRGIDPSRLVFAKKLAKPLHLARFRLADLLLDTFIYGAHTTASDALWAGVPVLTCPGEGFASRVGASLVTAVGLPELICPSREDYVERAVALATTDRPTLGGLRKRLQSNRLTEPLFDTERYARHMEDAFAAMWAAHERGERPRVIEIAARPRG